MGGPHLPEQIDNLIIETLITLRDLYGYEPTAKQVLNVLTKRPQMDDYADFEKPSLRTIQGRLKKARQREELHQSNSKFKENEPWSMLSLNSLPLPPESIPFVLQVWRYSLALDVVFTINHAKWVSRLYPLYKEKDISELWLDSQRYATEEKLSVLRGTPAKTYQLDSRLAMSEWERYTADNTDIRLNLPIGYVWHTIKPRAKDGGIAEEFIHALPSWDPYASYPDGKTYTRMWLILSLIEALPSSSKCFPNYETRMVYLRYLSYISKMPKWNELLPNEVKDIIVKLRELVINTIPETYCEHSPYPHVIHVDQNKRNKSHSDFHKGLNAIYERLGGDSL